MTIGIAFRPSRSQRRGLAVLGLLTEASLSDLLREATALLQEKDLAPAPENGRGEPLGDAIKTRIPPEAREDLDRIGATLGRSPSGTMRYAVDLLLARYSEALEAAEEPLQEAREAAQAVRTN